MNILFCSLDSEIDIDRHRYIKIYKDIDNDIVREIDR